MAETTLFSRLSIRKFIKGGYFIESLNASYLEQTTTCEKYAKDKV